MNGKVTECDEIEKKLLVIAARSTKCVALNVFDDCDDVGSP